MVDCRRWQSRMDCRRHCNMIFSFRNATFLVCFFNLVTALLLIQRFLGASSRMSPGAGLNPAQIRLVKEAEEARRAFEPVDLIKRLREIQDEATSDAEIIVQNKSPTKAAAVDLSKRLQDFRALNDANTKKVLEEWRKRKMERARKRELEVDTTVASQI